MKETLKDVFIGFSLFLSCYYILSVNPEILEKAHVPVAVSLLGTLLVLVFGNLRGAYTTGTGLIIAPAIGISYFFSDYVRNSSSLTWIHGMIASAIAGFLILITSYYTNWRTKIINELPFPIKIGVKAAIGSLLVDSGINLIREPISEGLIPRRMAIILAVLGMMIIFVIVLGRNNPNAGKKNSLWWKLQSFLSRFHLEHFIAVLAVTICLHLFADKYIHSFPAKTNLQFMYFTTDWANMLVSRDQFLLMVPLIAIIWFIVITDIPGTPGVVIPKKTTDTDREKYIENGFKNDGWFALLAPILGTTSTIYYAENLILQDSERYGKKIGYTVSAMFAICLLILVYQQFVPNPIFSISLQQLIPPIAVAPVLIYIGLYVISTSFVDEDIESIKNIQTSNTIKFLPASIAVVLTPIIGLEFSFPLSILSFWFSGVKVSDVPYSFKCITAGAAFTMVIYILMLLFQS